VLFPSDMSNGLAQTSVLALVKPQDFSIERSEGITSVDDNAQVSGGGKRLALDEQKFFVWDAAKVPCFATSKHKMTRYAKHFGGVAPWLRLWHR